MPTQEEYLKAADLLKQLCESIVESVRMAGGQGVPGGVIYAALMANGVGLETYERIMAVLVEAGNVRKSGHSYFAV